MKAIIFCALMLTCISMLFLISGVGELVACGVVLACPAIACWNTMFTSLDLSSEDKIPHY